MRKHARTEGRRYCDPVVLTYQAERMPEQIRLKVGGVTQHQITVYEEFVRNVPGFQPTNHDGSFMKQQPPPPPPQPPQQQPVTSNLHNDIANISQPPPINTNVSLHADITNVSN